MASSTATKTARGARRTPPRTPSRATSHASAPVSTPELPAPAAVEQTTQDTGAVQTEATGTTIEGLESLLKQLVHQQQAGEPSNRAAGARAAAGKSFKLGNDQLASILTSRGRRAMRSVYHDDIITAIENPGTYYGITIEPPLKAAWIISQIRKAARECGLNTRQYSTYNKESEGFVSYVVHQPVTPPQAVRSGSEQDR